VEEEEEARGQDDGGIREVQGQGGCAGEMRKTATGGRER
jgi:hypothetical protein